MMNWLIVRREEIMAQSLSKKDRARVYGLSFDLETEYPSLILTVEPDHIQCVRTIPTRCPAILSRLNDGTLNGTGCWTFTGRIKDGGRWGFNGALTIAKTDPRLLVKIPIVPVEFLDERELCHACGGLGICEYESTSCPSCDGTRKDRRFDYSTALAISSSLGLLLHRLDSCLDNKSGYGRKANPQLMSIEMLSLASADGGSLDGELSPLLCDWLASAPNLKKAIEAMAVVHRIMRPFSHGYAKPDLDFRIQFGDQGSLDISCPGNGCGIFSDNQDRPGAGFRFYSSNVDTMTQQMELLAALAVIHDLYDQATHG